MAEALIKLGQGCFSLTFLWQYKNKEYVLKCPACSGDAGRREWFHHIQKEILFLNEYAPKQRQIILPKVIEISDKYLVQNKVEGVPLTKEVYENLSLCEQKEIAKRMARFFFLLHKKTARNVSGCPKNTVRLKNYLTNLDADELFLYKNCNSVLKKNPCFCGQSCLCISDLKASHILYNPKNKQVGMVDFGTIHFDFPESEFVLKNPIRSHLSLKMMKDIVNAYNMLQKTDLISWERVKSFLFLYALKEVYSGFTNKSISSREKKRLKGIFSDFTKKLQRI